MCPRRYDLGRRRAGSEGTRQKILVATRTLLGGKGDPADFSMESVAVKAGVSRMTVYNQFHSESGLLDALADDLAGKGGMQRLREAFVESQPEEAVRRFVTTFVDFWASERVLLRRLRAFGVLLPALYKGIRERDEWRREGARNLVAKIGVRTGPGEAPGQEALVELLFSMTSFETFDGMCDDKRSPEDVAELLTTSFVALWGSGSTRGRTRIPARIPRRSQ
jgi:AcrR family transcriptional regulator